MFHSPLQLNGIVSPPPSPHSATFPHLSAFYIAIHSIDPDYAATFFCQTWNASRETAMNAVGALLYSANRDRAHHALHHIIQALVESDPNALIQIQAYLVGNGN